MWHFALSLPACSTCSVAAHGICRTCDCTWHLQDEWLHMAFARCIAACGGTKRLDHKALTPLACDVINPAAHVHARGILACGTCLMLLPCSTMHHPQACLLHFTALFTGTHCHCNCTTLCTAHEDAAACVQCVLKSFTPPCMWHLHQQAGGQRPKRTPPPRAAAGAIKAASSRR